LGVNVAVRQFENIGLGFDWTLANASAREWADRHTDDLLRQLGTTTHEAVGPVLRRWVDNGEPLDMLIQDLEPTFGARRAALIASTETTRAYTQGNLETYRASNVTKRAEWRTANDELVCPLCGPLNGVRSDNVQSPTFRHTDGTFYGPPPLHPSCRCWIVPVVEEAASRSSDSIPVSVDWSQVTPTQRRQIETAIGDVQRRYKGPNLISGIEWVDNPNIIARAGGTLKINPNNLTDDVIALGSQNAANMEFQRTQARLIRLRETLEKEGTSWSVQDRAQAVSRIDSLQRRLDDTPNIRFGVSDTQADVIVHELGHNIQTDLITGKFNDITDFLPPSKLRELGIDYEKTLGARLERIAKARGHLLSEYATTNDGEYFAEAFTLYMRGETQEINTELLDIFRKIVP
jgi:SPP1 gp7 family putative phage head morphogenesis protein